MQGTWLAAMGDEARASVRVGWGKVARVKAFMGDD